MTRLWVIPFENQIYWGAHNKQNNQNHDFSINTLWLSIFHQKHFFHLAIKSTNFDAEKNVHSFIKTKPWISKLYAQTSTSDTYQFHSFPPFSPLWSIQEHVRSSQEHVKSFQEYVRSIQEHVRSSQEHVWSTQEQERSYQEHDRSS